MKPGKWIYDKDGKDWNIGGWKCSVCGCLNNNIGGNDRVNPLIFSGSNYCPNCGARMDGKGKEEQEKNWIGGDTMEKLDTVQQFGKLNEVYRIGDKGPGGAYHSYAITEALRKDDENPVITIIKFQMGPRSDKTSRRGVLDVDLIEIVRDRLKAFQEGDYACEQNARAIGYIEAALEAMNERVEDRIKRGVLGTTKK